MSTASNYCKAKPVKITKVMVEVIKKVKTKCSLSDWPDKSSEPDNSDPSKQAWASRRTALAKDIVAFLNDEYKSIRVFSGTISAIANKHNF
jgi:hypothetical protein